MYKQDNWFEWKEEAMIFQTYYCQDPIQLMCIVLIVEFLFETRSKSEVKEASSCLLER